MIERGHGVVAQGQILAHRRLGRPVVLRRQRLHHRHRARARAVTTHGVVDVDEFPPDDRRLAGRDKHDHRARPRHSNTRLLPRQAGVSDLSRLIQHTDADSSRYTSFESPLLEADVDASVGSVGDGNDNAPNESPSSASSRPS